MSESQLNLFTEIECVVEGCFSPRQKREYCNRCYQYIYLTTGEAPPKFCAECGVQFTARAPTGGRGPKCCELCRPVRKKRNRFRKQQRVKADSGISLETRNTAQCRICGEWRERIVPGHAQSHGLTTDEYKALFPDAPLIADSWGKRLSITQSGKRPHPNFRSKPKGVYQTCQWCDADYYVPPYLIGKAKFCSWPCMRKGRSGMRGSESHLWRGGYKEYYGSNWQEQRRLARARDNYQCQHCGLTEEEQGSQMDVHHIIRFADFGVERYLEANELTNLECLCHLCHIYETQRELTERG